MHLQNAILNYKDSFPKFDVLKHQLPNEWYVVLATTTFFHTSFYRTMYCANTAFYQSLPGEKLIIHNFHSGLMHIIIDRKNGIYKTYVPALTCTRKSIPCVSSVARAGVTPISVVASCINMAAISAFTALIHICSSHARAWVCSKGVICDSGVCNTSNECA